MNKRQRKKNQKKQEMFLVSWVHSYKELKKFDRMYHEYEVSSRRRMRNYDADWLNHLH